MPPTTEAADGHPPDPVLVRRARLGDKQAFAAIVTRHGAALYRYASRVLDDRSATEDVLQDAFLDAWRGLPSFRGDSSLRTWLFTLVRHRVSRQLGRRSAVPQTGFDDAAADIADPAPDPAQLSLGRDLREALDSALRLLPDRQRSAWLLREVEQLSYAEVGLVLGVSPTVVRGLLERARVTLATTLKEWR
ncbi:sigma-70 family RNA polymerase sigma factor [Cryptosporangium japonicum]|uniref:Sigma-70 family RNA polymerase sigma factor n=1 Tax=Cryptosporangium japonicum TaxID=80872 RepID=A0ABP3DEH5_9ACTN